MLTENGAKTDPTYLPSNPLARAGAYVVDWYIACVLTEIAILLTDLMLYREILNATGHIKLADDAGVWAYLLLNLVVLALLTVYFAVIPGMTEGEHRGQTLGMRLFKLKVVAADLSDASVKRLFLRHDPLFPRRAGASRQVYPHKGRLRKKSIAPSPRLNRYEKEAAYGVKSEAPGKNQRRCVRP